MPPYLASRPLSSLFLNEKLNESNVAERKKQKKIRGRRESTFKFSKMNGTPMEGERHIATMEMPVRSMREAHYGNGERVYVSESSDREQILVHIII